MNYLFAGVLGLSAGFLINCYVNIKKFDYSSLKNVYKLIFEKRLYIIVEAAVIIVFEYIFYCFSEPVNIAKYCLLTGILVAAALEDVKERVITNKLMVFSLFSSIVLAVLSFKQKVILDSIILFAITFGVLLFLYFLSRGGIGLGDVKLFASISMFLGARGIISVFAAAVILSGIISLILIISKRIKRKDTIPFAPFILAATILLLSYF